MKKFFIYVLLLISGVVISSQSFGQLTFYINEVEVEINNSYTIIISFNEDTIYNVVGQIPIIEKSKINNEN
jgi:hypothetical protein